MWLRNLLSLLSPRARAQRYHRGAFTPDAGRPVASPPPLPKSSDSTKRYATLYEIYMRQVVTSERLGEGRKAVYIVAISITEAISQATYSNPGYRVTDIRAVAGGALSIDLIIMPDAK